MDHRAEVFEVLSKMADQLDRIQAEAARVQGVLSLNRSKLNNGQPIGKLDTLFGISTLADMVNAASRWEGQLWERIELGHENELSTERPAERLALNLPEDWNDGTPDRGAGS